MTDQQRARKVVGPDYLLAGRYRLSSKIGGGGMGAVWLANDTLLDRQVAVKQVTSTAELSENDAEEVRTRAMREGRLAAQLSSPHAIAMHDVALEDGEPWLVMEYLSSRSLAQALHFTESLPPFEVAQIGAQVADALAEAHAAGIVHRDIKPGNILIADRGHDLGMVKISDFGISRAKGDIHEADSSVITGTPAYFAPEVARGEDPTDASDVFSLGATLYTATEGKPPFGMNEDSIALLHKVAQARIEPPHRSGDLTTVLLHMLEPDPARRPTMAEARDELITSAISKQGRISAIRGVPLTSAHGAVPGWARRSTPVSDTRNNYQQFGRTITGLPAVRPGSAPPRASHPSGGPSRYAQARKNEQGSARSRTAQPRETPQPAPSTYSPPPFDIPRKKTAADYLRTLPAPLMIALAILVVVIIVVALIVIL